MRGEGDFRFEAEFRWRNPSQINGFRINSNMVRVPSAVSVWPFGLAEATRSPRNSKQGSRRYVICGIEIGLSKPNRRRAFVEGRCN